MSVKRGLMAGTLAVAVGLAASPVWAESVAVERPPWSKRPTSQALVAELERRIALDPCRGSGADRPSSEPTPELVCVADTLDLFADSYRDRAARRQNQSDAASGLSTLSVIALLAGGAGAAASTTAAWSFGATTPIVVDDLRAPRYRGMLDTAGGLALNDIADRYRMLDLRVAALVRAQSEAPAQAGQRPKDIREACNSLVSARVTLRELPEDSRRTLLTAGLDELVTRCWEQVRARDTLREYGDLWKAERAVLAARAAADGLEVTRRIDLLDRSMRTTPFEAIRTTAAAPFLTVGNVIKGEKTAFTGREDPRKDRDYVIELRSLGVAPTLPAELKTEIVVTAAMRQALNELSAVEKKKKGGGLSTRLDEVSTALSVDVDGLVTSAQTLNAQRRLALRVAELDADRKVNVDPRLLTSKVEAAPAASSGPAPAKAATPTTSTE